MFCALYADLQMSETMISYRVGMKGMKKLFFLAFAFTTLICASLPAEITYSYTPEFQRIWTNGQSQGNFFNPLSGDVTEVAVKMLKLGTLFIDGLPQNQSSGTTLMLMGLPTAPVVIHGTIITHNNIVETQWQDNLVLVGQYYPNNGQRTQLVLSGNASATIQLFPEYKKSSLTMDVYLVIDYPVKMLSGTSYTIDNLAEYSFALVDGATNQPLTGDGINTSDNPFTGDSTNPTWTGTPGAVQPSLLKAELSLLGYPARNFLDMNPTIQIPSSIQILQAGVNLAYLKIAFDPNNGNAGATKDLVVSISHDTLKSFGSSREYEYSLAIEHDSGTGTVTTENLPSDFSPDAVSYTLKNSSAGDTDIKLLKFRLDSNSFGNALAGTYSSTIMIELRVEG